MLGLEPSIHTASTDSRAMDPRVKPEDDGAWGGVSPNSPPYKAHRVLDGSLGRLFPQSGLRREWLRPSLHTPSCSGLTRASTRHPPSSRGMDPRLKAEDDGGRRWLLPNSPRRRRPSSGTYSC
ncbi:hypothetical protein EFD56_09010 [Rhizobium phaseoli]|nr:hypothetical protein EFD56_09010 [Rhizobium phaseoli]